MSVTFEYGFSKVRDLQAIGERDRRTGKVQISSIVVDGRTAIPTRRFWKSFFVRFGIADNVFRYFEPTEVFRRISERCPEDQLRFCVERDEEDGKSRLLAVSHPDRGVVRYGEILDIASRHGGNAPQYAEGIVTTTHVPGSGEYSFQIGGDEFQRQFVMETPVDGFSHPKIYLSLLRQVCSNGMVGYTRAFRSDVSLGRDIAHCIRRALETYDNGEGYAALRQRFESAQTSWASVRECMQVYKCLTKSLDRGEFNSTTVLRDFYQMTGNLNELYGLANLNALSNKRQRILPARCRIYDLLNFVSELGTHHATAAGSRSMQACVGNLICDEYDLEGTADSVGDFQDFLVSKDRGESDVLRN